MDINSSTLNNSQNQSAASNLNQMNEVYKPGSPFYRNRIVTYGLDINLLNKRNQQALKWGSINIAILAIVLYDLSHKCPYANTYWYYIEYFIVILLILSILYYFGKYFYTFFNFAPVTCTAEQRNLLQINETDSTLLKSLNRQTNNQNYMDSADTSYIQPANITTLSWNSSFNDSSRSIGSSGWIYNRGRSSMQQQQQQQRQHQNQSFNTTWNLSQNTSNLSGAGGTGSGGGGGGGGVSSTSFSSPYNTYTTDEHLITDEIQLKKYLHDVAVEERRKPDPNYEYGGNERGTMNSIWNYCNSAANLLKTSIYQMSPTTAISPIKQNITSSSPTSASPSKDNQHYQQNQMLDVTSGGGGGGSGSGTTVSGGGGGGSNRNPIISSKTKIDDIHSNTHGIMENLFNPCDFMLLSGSNSEVIKRIASTKLSKYLTNLRMWLSSTILIRLVNEIHKIDIAFKTRGLPDLQIGNVGLERLKKTAENQQLVSVHVPILPLVLPFLVMSSNQEYLVKRIKDLAKGSCIAEYSWNSGGSYHGMNWDEHLPTDSAILFHLFCAYMDSQLMPLPQPGGRPFYSRYVILGDKKSARETIDEIKNKSRCAILCTNEIKPKFNFISDDKIHNCVHDRNNLFYVIIQFLLYMKANHGGLLEGVNLGKSGINILGVIED